MATSPPLVPQSPCSQSDLKQAWRSPQVQCPTLVLHGTRDDIIPLESSQRLVQKFPFVELRILEDDHSLSASQETINSAVMTWFALCSD